MFAGKSSLRAKETVTAKVDPALQAYLQRYQSAGANGSAGGSNSDGKTKRKKKKQKPAASALGGGFRIVDESVTGFTPANKAAAQAAEEEEDDDDDYGVPVLANAEEAELAARQVEAAKTGFYGTGSGWQKLGDGDEDGAPGARGGQAGSRHDSDSDDAEPARRRARHDADSDAEPARRRPRHDSDSDAEPVRRRPADGDSDSDAEPARRPRQRHDSDSDPEPTRRPAAGRRMRHDSDDDDVEPPRRLRGGSDSDSDASPPRPKRGRPAGGGGVDDEDLSPPRKRSAASAEPAASTRQPGRTMTDGTATGMITAGQLKAELDRKRAADREQFARLDAATTGRGAQTVFRDKEGKAVSREELEAARKAELEKKAKERETPEWAAGLRQQRDAAERRAAMAAEAAKPFARSRDDRDLDAMYRNQTRFGDPMAQYVKKRQPDEPPPVLPPPGKRRKAGFVVPQAVPPHSWLKRGIGGPINRYGIKAGRHWDGVDRSNGFEAKMFRTKNERSFIDGLAFSYGQEDM